MRKILALLLGATLLITTSFNVKTKDDIVNYLNTSDILHYNKTDYKLVWSSHPASNYYKQEYIPKHQSVDHYDTMLLIDFLMIDTPVINIVGAKINELKERKKTDAVANYRMLKNSNNGELLLDFILSDGNSEKVNIVELNGYRYKNYTDNTGHKGILLFGISKRAYDSDVLPFLQNLNNNRQDLLKILTDYNIPDINVN